MEEQYKRKMSFSVNSFQIINKKLFIFVKKFQNAVHFLEHSMVSFVLLQSTDYPQIGPTYSYCTCTQKRGAAYMSYSHRITIRARLPKTLKVYMCSFIIMMRRKFPKFKMALNNCSKDSIRNRSIQLSKFTF